MLYDKFSVKWETNLSALCHGYAISFSCIKCTCFFDYIIAPCCFNVSISETSGVFEWTPINLNVARVGLAAIDDKDVATVLVVEVHNCDCQNNGTCDYTIDQNSSVEDNYYVSCTFNRITNSPLYVTALLLRPLSNGCYF